MFYAAVTGGWSFLWVIILCWGLFSVLDVVLGINPVNHNPNTEEKDLIGYTLVTLIWPPLHFITLFGLLWYVGQSSHTFAEKVGLFYAVGVLGGVIGINYSHELMHRSDRLRRHLADGLLAIVLYSHFRSEHLLVHHKYVGTPRDRSQHDMERATMPSLLGPWLGACHRPFTLSVKSSKKASALGTISKIRFINI